MPGHVNTDTAEAHYPTDSLSRCNVDTVEVPPYPARVAKRCRGMFSGPSHSLTRPPKRHRADAVERPPITPGSGIVTTGAEYLENTAASESQSETRAPAEVTTIEEILLGSGKQDAENQARQSLKRKLLHNWAFKDRLAQRKPKYLGLQGTEAYRRQFCAEKLQELVYLSGASLDHPMARMYSQVINGEISYLELVSTFKADPYAFQVHDKDIPGLSWIPVFD